MSIIDKITKNGLLKSSMIYTICAFLIKGINFITFPIFSRMLTPTDYGVTSVFSTWVGFVIVFGSIQLNSCIPTAKAKFEKNKYEELIITILSFVTILFCMLILISILLKNTLSKMIGLSGNLIILMTIQSFFSFISTLYNTILIQDSKDKKYLVISLLSTILNVLLSIILVMLMKENEYIGKILGTFISTILIGLIMYFKISRGKFFINKNLLKFAIKISLPIVPHILSHQVLTSSDRIMLNSFIGSKSVGIYGFAYNIGMIIQIIWGAINNAWIPWYFKNMEENNEEKIKKASINYIMGFTAITILLIFITPELGKILAPKDYWIGINVVPLVAFSYFFVFLYSFPVNIQFYKEKTKYIPIGTVLAAIVNILLNYIFIPKYGILAATISTLISYILLFVFHMLTVKYLLKYQDINTKYYLISIVAVLIFILLFYLTIANLVYRYLILVLVIAYIYMKKDNLKKLRN
ncbi:MAG: oligosaccharide flippase family protein [Paeniclostridium sordellii]|nr:oligosaccharide flippase family protein [Paeniclostridium sordellii]